MGDGFAHGKRGLVQIQRAFKEYGQHLSGRAWRVSAGSLDFGQSFLVVRMQLLYALVQPDEGLAMRGQHQGICGQGFEFINGA